jgi:glycosyltransferase involved in cell wall biosynthesis
MLTRIHVAVVAACPFPYERGTPIRIRRLAEGLARRGHDVDVITYHLGDSTPLAGIRTHRIAPVRGYTKTGPGPNLRKILVLDRRLVMRLRQFLAAHHVDVIHAHHVEGLLAALLARSDRRIRIVFDAHTSLTSELPYYGPAAVAALMAATGRILDRVLPSYADHTVTVTPELHQRLMTMGRIDPTRISVVGNGIEFELFDAAMRQARPGGDPTLIFTGNLASYQGIDLMLRAFALVRERRRDVRLKIVSQASFAPFQQMAIGLGIREALDIVEAGFEVVPAHLAQADIALNPRLDTPGIAQKTLNYMIMGLPLVSFAGSGRHLVDGDNALLVEDGNIAAFAAAIDRLIDDPDLAHRLGNNAKRHVQEKNNWETSVRKLEAILFDIVDNPGRSRQQRRVLGAPDRDECGSIRP